MNEIKKVDNEIVYSGFKLLKNGIEAIGKPTFEQWQECWKFVGKADGAVRFWRGDLIRYAEHTYGEMYTQFINDTGKDYITLRHDKSVAENVDLCRRRHNLTFDHHQEVAYLEPIEQDKLLDMAEKQNIKSKDFRRVVKEYKKKIEANKVGIKETPKGISFIHSDFRTTDIKENSIDCIITDPPYPSEFLPLWTDLSLFASKVLKPSGFLIAYSGELNLPQVIQNLSTNLVYYWTFALYHEGQTQLVMPRNIMCGWKPILVYQKPPFKKIDHAVSDRLISEKPEKSLHEWQQSESGVIELINRFTEEGHVVLDPFSGSGTFPIVAYNLKRQAIGIEINEVDYKLSLKRVNDKTKV